MMQEQNKCTFGKQERLCSTTLIEMLFQEGDRTASAYPIRAIFLPVDKSVQQNISVLVSVPKKRIRKAVDRNRVKRQIREAYRKHKHTLSLQLKTQEKGLLLAFVYVSDKLEPTSYIESRLQKLLEKVVAKI